MTCMLCCYQAMAEASVMLKKLREQGILSGTKLLSCYSFALRCTLLTLLLSDNLPTEQFTNSPIESVVSCVAEVAPPFVP